ncbi:sugar ABC transporter permease [[Mycoplasma] falconis]|uniref:Sugar ABC transporter permease n=1 Tax=[Mycoplasma] falconis TaxID=92403 RepID=A0A501XBW2_9BACT|nr:sugar ABC transporter permease [[Mycoplasma] falconis]TPE58040.1 sugar ABC transporter permease [[Mycoplasma] falconis]
MWEYFRRKYRIKKTGDALSALNQKTAFWKPFLLMLPSLITITLMTIIPFILVIIWSFKVENGPRASQFVIGFNNYAKIFNDDKYIVGIRNSFIYALLSLPMSLAISILISTAITMVVKKWARSFWQTVFFLPYVTSAIAVSLTFAYIFQPEHGDGLINSILGKHGSNAIKFLNGGPTSWSAFIVILTRGIWGSLAFQILILTTAMLSVNQNLYKSASIDGASQRKQFFTITLPSIQRTISFLFTMGIIGGIKVFPLAIFGNNAKAAVINGGSSLMLYVYYLTSDSKFNTAAAASIMLFIFGVALSFVMRKLAALTYKGVIKIGERNVLNKIENKTLKRTISFKI